MDDTGVPWQVYVGTAVLVAVTSLAIGLATQILANRHARRVLQEDLKFRREQMEADSASRRDEWLREQKKQAYGEVLRACHDVYFARYSRGADPFTVAQAFTALLGGAILVGNEEVSQCAKDIQNKGIKYLESGAAKRFAEPDARPDIDHAKVHKDFAESLDAITYAMRADMMR